MPISHKIRQYRALLRFAHPHEVLQSVEQAEGVVPKQGIWRVLCTKFWLAVFVGTRDWSPGTKPQSIIGGSPWAQAARRISLPILTE